MIFFWQMLATSMFQIKFLTWKMTYFSFRIAHLDFSIWYVNNTWNIDSMKTIARNTITSPNFLVRKFWGKAQFPHSFGRFTQNYAETVPFHKISTLGNLVKLGYFTQWKRFNDSQCSCLSFSEFSSLNEGSWTLASFLL